MYELKKIIWKLNFSPFISLLIVAVALTFDPMTLKSTQVYFTQKRHHPLKTGEDLIHGYKDIIRNLDLYL